MQIVNRRLTIPEWTEYVKGYDFGTLGPDRVVLHHTWVPRLDQWRGQRSIDGLKAYYESKGWSAAPHIFVGPDGIWLFTPMDEVGIHAGLGNANLEFISGKDAYTNFKKLRWYSVGVEMVGDYDKVRPGGEVWKMTQAVLAGLVKRFGVQPELCIGFHRHFTNAKSCPGWAVTEAWVHSEVNAYLALEDKGLTVVHEPRISQATFERVLAENRSPASPYASALWKICVDEGIDPGVALAFFRHESSYGKAGITLIHDTKNWGNVRTPEDKSLGIAVLIPGRGHFVDYPTWENGLLDWCKRLKGPKYAGEGRRTVESIVPKYAPSSDNNNPARYIAAIHEAIKGWQNMPQPRMTYNVKTTVDGLNIRQGASVRYPVAGKIPVAGTLVLCDGTKDEGEGLWQHLANGSGFISGKYTIGV